MALELCDLTKTFGGVVAVQDVSLTVSDGKITSLIGPNGAGKTTLFNLISGFLKPDKGEISYNGRRIDGLSPWEIARRGIGRLFQDVRVFDKLSVLENVVLAQSNPGENPIRALFQRQKTRRGEKENIKAAEGWLEFVGLSDKQNTLAENLSYGQQKLLAIARLLAGKFDFFLLDEPTAGVNPAMVKPILGLIRRLSSEGKTVMVIEHNMTVVLEISDWVYFLDGGQVVSFGLPDDVLGDVTVRKAYLGL